MAEQREERERPSGRDANMKVPDARWREIAAMAAQGLPEEWSRYLGNRWARLSGRRRPAN